MLSQTPLLKVKIKDTVPAATPNQSPLSSSTDSTSTSSPSNQGSSHKPETNKGLEKSAEVSNN
jgi:hypothetical protein